MYCIRCGNQLPDDAKVCTYCGAPVEQAGNQTNGYNNGNFNNNMNYNNMNNNYGYQGQPRGGFGYQMTPEADSKFKKLLIFCIIELICCNQLTGVIALIFIILGKNGYTSGNFQQFEKYNKYATYVLIAGVILSLLCGGLYFGVGLIGGLAGY
ncbi:MAG: zinc ribbon domain-containing protein [bacterium]|nr:zinc ribbon domain-containing protein [bacterium]